MTNAVKTAGVAFFTNPKTGERVVTSDGTLYSTKSHNIYQRLQQKRAFHLLFKCTGEHEYRITESMREAIAQYNGEFDVEVIETSTFEEASIILEAELIKSRKK